MARIYLSATLEDLKEHRRVVYAALRTQRHDVVTMEHYGARPGRPLAECLEDVASCDVYVGILAWRYGYVPEDQPARADGTRLGFTHLEYEHAGACGVRRLVFVADEDAPWPPSQMDDDLAAIRTFRRQAQTEVIVGMFRGPDDLGMGVASSVASHLAAGPSTDADTTGHVRDAAFTRRVFREWVQQLTGREHFFRRLFIVAAALTFVVVALAAFRQDAVLALGSTVPAGIAAFPMWQMLEAQKRRTLLSGYALALEREIPTPQVLREIRTAAEQLTWGTGR